MYTAAKLCGRLLRGFSNLSVYTLIGLVVASVAVGLIAGCAPVTSGELTSAGSGCAVPVEALPASGSSSLIAVVPRTSAGAAVWGLDELAQLLPSAARAGMELHVFYSQDSDDLGEGGGDGGPPQVVLTSAPSFPAFQVTGAPQRPADPTPLSARLYCRHLGAWLVHASRVLHAEIARRAALLATWAKTTAARLTALAGRPIPDTTGSEAGGEIDSGGSIFAAALVAEAAPHPTVLVLGGLTALSPPSVKFGFPARLVALIRSSDPGQVVGAEFAWTRWAHRAGGSFEALSSSDSPAVIAGALDGQGQPG